MREKYIEISQHKKMNSLVQMSSNLHNFKLVQSGKSTEKVKQLEKTFFDSLSKFCHEI